MPNEFTRITAVAVTFVRGLELTEIGAVLSLDWSSEWLGTFSDVEEAAMETLINTGAEHYLVQAEQLGDWTVLVEPNGYLGSTTSLLLALSRRDRAVSAFWNVDGLQSFSYAIGGTLVRDMDVLLYPQQAQGAALAEEEGISWGVENKRRKADMLEVCHRITGVEVTEEWLLGTARRTWTATPTLF